MDAKYYMLPANKCHLNGIILKQNLLHSQFLYQRCLQCLTTIEQTTITMGGRAILVILGNNGPKTYKEYCLFLGNHVTSGAVGECLFPSSPWIHQCSRYNSEHSYLLGIILFFSYLGAETGAKQYVAGLRFISCFISTNKRDGYRFCVVFLLSSPLLCDPSLLSMLRALSNLAITFRENESHVRTFWSLFCESQLTSGQVCC